MVHVFKRAQIAELLSSPFNDYNSILYVINLIPFINKIPLLCILQEKISKEMNMPYWVLVDTFCKNY